MDILHCICPLENKFKVKVADFDLAVDTGSRVPQSLRGIKCEAVKPVWIKGTPFTRAPEVGLCVCVCVYDDVLPRCASPRPHLVYECTCADLSIFCQHSFWE